MKPEIIYNRNEKFNNTRIVEKHLKVNKSIRNSNTVYPSIGYKQSNSIRNSSSIPHRNKSQSIENEVLIKSYHPFISNNNKLKSIKINCNNAQSSKAKLYKPSVKIALKKNNNNNISHSFIEQYHKDRKEKTNKLLGINHSEFEIHDEKYYYHKTSIKQFSCLTHSGEQFGFNKINQDAHLALFNYQIKTLKDNDKETDRRNIMSLFGVFDGHGNHGHFISKTVKTEIEDYFTQSDAFNRVKDKESLRDFIRNNQYEIINQAYSKASNALKSKLFDSTLSGSTCLLVIVLNDAIICSNVGDSRAILYSNMNSPKGYKIIELSKDHKPVIKEECERIIKNGGFISRSDGDDLGPFRVWIKYKSIPGLTLTRSIGDFIAESVGVISIPEIREISTNESKFNYIVIASDGLWEWMSNYEVGKLVFPYYKQKNSFKAAQLLVDTVRKKWLRRCRVIDDITVIVIFF